MAKLSLLLAAFMLCSFFLTACAASAPAAPIAPVEPDAPAPELAEPPLETSAPTEDAPTETTPRPVLAGMGPGPVILPFSGDYTPAQKFSTDVLHALAEAEGKDPLLSPVSAYMALSLAMNGADGETLAGFAKALHTDVEGVSALCRTLAQTLRDTEGSTEVSLANAVWTDESAQVLPDYLTRVTEVLWAEWHRAALSSDKALSDINAWVSERTKGLIPTLQEKNFPPDTMLLLLNALYIKTGWQHPFNAELTRDKDFTRADGSVCQAPFMQQLEKLDYIDADAAQGVALPYDDGKTVFVALLPKEGSARELAAKLDVETLNAYLNDTRSVRLSLSLPKFTVEYSLEMNTMLKAMGLEAAFDPAQADFSRMGRGASGPLFIGTVLQKVKLIVDEKGTEAAAVTGVTMRDGALPAPPQELTFDRPFVYAMVDKSSGVPLFVGVLEELA